MEEEEGSLERWCFSCCLNAFFSLLIFGSGRRILL